MSLYPDSIVCPVCDRLLSHAWNENARCKCSDPPGVLAAIAADGRAAANDMASDIRSAASDFAADVRSFCRRG